MCIAIYKPEGALVTKTALQHSFSNNRDGAGYVFANDGELTIKKGFFTFKEFWASYSRDMKQFGNPVALIHFRIATHGEINNANCHPFALGDDHALIHNGMIDCGMVDKEMSDTYNFVNHVLAPIIANFGNAFFSDVKAMELVGMAIGYSKLAIIDKSGEVTLVNSELGIWDGGVWYSNDSYEPKKSVATKYSTRGSYSSGWERQISGGWGDESDDDVDDSYTSGRVCPKPTSDEAFDEMADVARRYKLNRNEQFASFDPSALHGKSLAEIEEMDDEEFWLAVSKGR